jgi:hypothetical protein
MFWLIVGIAIGYFFKPQIDKILGKVIRKLRDERDKRNYY